MTKEEIIKIIETPGTPEAIADDLLDSINEAIAEEKDQSYRDGVEEGQCSCREIDDYSGAELLHALSERYSSPGELALSMARSMKMSLADMNKWEYILENFDRIRIPLLDPSAR